MTERIEQGSYYKTDVIIALALESSKANYPHDPVKSIILYSKTASAPVGSIVHVFPDKVERSSIGELTSSIRGLTAGTMVEARDLPGKFVITEVYHASGHVDAIEVKPNAYRVRIPFHGIKE